MNGRVVRQAIRATGAILLTIGVVGLLFFAYLVWGTGLRAASAQRALSGELNQEWRQGPVRGDAVGASPERFDVATGQPFAFIRIPAFGQQWRYTLIQGTALAQLNVSPGSSGSSGWHRPTRPCSTRCPGIRGSGRPGGCSRSSPATRPGPAPTG